MSLAVCITLHELKEKKKKKSFNYIAIHQWVGTKQIHQKHKISSLPSHHRRQKKDGKRPANLKTLSNTSKVGMVSESYQCQTLTALKNSTTLQ